MAYLRVWQMAESMACLMVAPTAERKDDLTVVYLASSKAASSVASKADLRAVS
jgi:hypothetical protein